MRYDMIRSVLVTDVTLLAANNNNTVSVRVQYSYFYWILVQYYSYGLERGRNRIVPYYPNGRLRVRVLVPVRTSSPSTLCTGTIQIVIYFLEKYWRNLIPRSSVCMVTISTSIRYSLFVSVRTVRIIGQKIRTVLVR